MTEGRSAITEGPQTVHDVLTHVGRHHADDTALVYRGQSLRYGELLARACILAKALRGAGVAPNMIVGVALPRSIDAIVTIVAILEVGAAYLPLDPSYPAERTEHMLRDAGACLVITRGAHAVRFGSHAPLLVLDAPGPSPRALATPPQPHALAYIMYTSGSTGAPRGIGIPHAAILRLVIAPNFMHLGPGTRMLQAAPLGFDASTLEIWGPLLNGGVCVLHDEDLPTPTGLAQTIRNHQVNSAWLTAALFNAVVDAGPEHLEGLSQLLSGGEALSVRHVRRALQALPETRLINGYGPTECTTFATAYTVPHDLSANVRSVPIGKPINATTVHVLDTQMQPVPTGEVGELYVGGAGLGMGYLNRHELTAERFIPDPFNSEPGARLYRTGDLVRQLADGNLDYIGRVDAQVKIRGYRIEPGEIEARLAEHAAVRSCAVIARAGTAGGARLLAYVVPSDQPVAAAELRAHLAARLPDYMVPATFTWLPALPVTPNGKLDARALPETDASRPNLATPFEAAHTPLEAHLCEVFAQALGFEQVGRLDNFFDLGGNSLLVLRVLALLGGEGEVLGTNAFFSQPTPAALAARLVEAQGGMPVGAQRDISQSNAAPPHGGSEPIAIIAVAGRFPGATDVEALWQMLVQGRDGITHFNDAELDPSIPPALGADPSYVKARGVVDGVENFDAAFFGISPHEAALMDPQQRVFLQLCWECLERAGHAPDANRFRVGVFAGMHTTTYFRNHVQHRQDLVEALGAFQVMLGNEKDYIANRVANRLNLTGPAVAVNSACSTSLVAIAQAVLALRAGQCEMALAGGSSINCPPRSGYMYEEGAMLSPDGATRTFSADAQGTVFSDGAAVVLLKNLADAQRDRDPILAVIRGVAVNNDGRDKASFTAPSVDGQAAVIEAALRDAQVDARSISYVEAHGTATPMGDPVEVAALTQAFRQHTQDVGFCRIGSLKSNVGHMVIAAGAGGVIKTALALAAGQLPPSIHYATPNPRIDFAHSPFTVCNALTPWPRGEQPRRAGVSGFGVGGTNAHVVMEEAPLRPASSAPVGPQLLMLSAKTSTALDAMAGQLATHFRAHPDVNLADAAHTLQFGRSVFAHRLCVVASNDSEAVEALQTPGHALRLKRQVNSNAPPQIWLFSGQGAQYVGMGSGLYAADPAFRAAFDAALQALAPHLSFDLRAQMLDDASLTQTATTQPALFALEYALAQSWLARGAQPAAFIGHSVGEFVCAVLAQVMTLGDAARLVAKRGALMQAQPPGSMLSVRLPMAEMLARLPATIAIAAENAPTACVAAGPTPDVQAWQTELEAAGVQCRLLQTSHAFHSPMMDGALDAFAAAVEATTLSSPVTPIASSRTGTWMSGADATSADYWVRHLREPVRFSPAVREALARHPAAAFLEIGPRATLAALARQHGPAGGIFAVSSLGDAPERESAHMLLAQGALWTAGIDLPAPAANPATGRHRVQLPTYAFERKRFWIDAPVATTDALSTVRQARTVTPAVIAESASIGSDVAQTPPPSAAVLAFIPHPYPTAMSTTVTATAAAPASVQRTGQIVSRLREVFEDVSGEDLSQADSSAAFVELGIDSLTLTQVTLQVKKEFGVPVTFRQLMESLRTMDQLAVYIDAQLPPEPAAPAPELVIASVQSAAATPQPLGFAAMRPSLAMPPINTGVQTTAVQQLIQQQMQLMAQQLALLGGMPSPVMQAPAVAPVTADSAAVPQAALTASSTSRAPVATAASTAPDDVDTQRYDVKKAFGAIARIHTQANPLTERQRARLAAFMRRYVERTPKSRAYTAQHRDHLADPRVVNGFRPMIKDIVYQIVIERSKGAHLWDLDGNQYVDVLNGFGMSLFGWQPDFVLDAVREQLNAGYDIGPQHPLAGPVADLICEITGFDRAGLCNTGSEAVMAAVRMARTVTGRSTVVLFTGSYHGTFDEVVVRAGRNAKGIPGAPGIMRGMFGDVRVLDYGTPESLEFIRGHAQDLAAVLVEPVQSRRPEFRPVDFLKEVRAITERSGTCLIFDEVITGFRSALGGTQALFGIRADLATYGKVIGGGMPIGVVAGKRAFMDALDGGPWQYGDDSIPSVGVTYFAGTFVRHPLALAAAHASLLYLKEQGPALQEKLNTATTALAEELSAFCREVGAPLQIRYFASLWRVAWLEDHPLQDLLFAMMRSRGVHILDNFPCFLTTAHSEADIRLIASAFKDSVRELQESEFLPRRASPVSVAFEASKPPVPGARLGRDPTGKAAWYVPNPDNPAQFLKVGA